MLLEVLAPMEVEGIDFPVAAIWACWWDGASSTQQALHYSNPGLPVTRGVSVKEE